MTQTLWGSGKDGEDLKSPWGMQCDQRSTKGQQPKPRGERLEPKDAGWMSDGPSTLADSDAHATDPGPCFLCCRKTNVTTKGRAGFPSCQMTLA